MTKRVSGNDEALLDLAKMATEPLAEELVPYVEESEWGPMLRHPLVYQIPMLTGLANRALAAKRDALAKAIEDEDWNQVVFLHERPYRLRALIDYVTGRDDEGNILSLGWADQWARDLACDVWVDSENIQQQITEWRALFDNGNVPFLGTPEEQTAFEALPRVMIHGTERIHAWRGGAVGDWSWTTDQSIAAFFSRRSGFPVRGHHIPVADVFGYLTRRGEAELLVRFTPFRSSLVYPDGCPVSRN